MTITQTFIKRSSLSRRKPKETSVLEGWIIVLSHIPATFELLPGLQHCLLYLCVGFSVSHNHRACSVREVPLPPTRTSLSAKPLTHSPLQTERSHTLGEALKLFLLQQIFSPSSTNSLSFFFAKPFDQRPLRSSFVTASRRRLSIEVGDDRSRDYPSASQPHRSIDTAPTTHKHEGPKRIGYCQAHSALIATVQWCEGGMTSSELDRARENCIHGNGWLLATAIGSKGGRHGCPARARVTRGAGLGPSMGRLPAWPFAGLDRSRSF